MRYGPTGLERNQNEILSGEAPELIAGQLSDLITGRDPRGGNVELNIEPAVQQAAYTAMTDKNYVGAVVAIEPSTGNVLAMVSTPSYDPNPLASHSDAVQRQAYNDLVNADPSPLLNRATAAVYPPGSTFKLVIASAALQQGYTPQTPVTGEAKISLPDTGGATLSNFAGETCGDGGGADVPLIEALAHSCNTAFAEVAMSLGVVPVRKQAEALGIDSPVRTSGSTWSESRLGDVPDTAALAQTGIGQRDVAMTPFQMAWITATIANRGDMMAPHLIAKTTKPDLSVISETSPQSLGQAIPIAVADQVRDMMIQSEKDTPGSGGIADLVDRLQDRHRRTRHRPEEHPPARLVRGLRAGGQPEGRGRGDGRERRRSRPGRHRRQGRRADRTLGDRRRAGRGAVMSAPGLVLSDRYRLNHRIAVGGMGEVWAADDIRLARVVAREDPATRADRRPGVRRPVPHRGPDHRVAEPPGHRRGLRLRRGLGGAGPYLSGTAYLVMELIAGESLSAVLARTGRLSVARTLDVLDQTGRALQQAHARSLVHRDIKPGNLLITPAARSRSPTSASPRSPTRHRSPGPAW